MKPSFPAAVCRLAWVYVGGAFSVREADEAAGRTTIELKAICDGFEPRVSALFAAPARALDSPHVQAEWNSGVVDLRKGPRAAMLDFNDRAPFRGKQ